MCEIINYFNRSVTSQGFLSSTRTFIVHEPKFRAHVDVPTPWQILQVPAVRDMTGAIEVQQILSTRTCTCRLVLVQHTTICVYTVNFCQPLNSTIFATKRYWQWLITLCIIWRCEKCLGFQIWFVTEFRREINQSSALPCGQMSYIANKVLILQSKRAYSYIRLLILLTDVRILTSHKTTFLEVFYETDLKDCLVILSQWYQL